MKEYFIYVITNDINNKKYIGKSKEPFVRFGVHKTIAKGGPEIYKNRFFYLHKAIRKYGPENFSIEIIDSIWTENEDDIFEREEYWITKFREENYLLYNLTDRGEGPSGMIHSKETRMKMSENRTIKTGQDHHGFGKPRDEETKKKISETRIERQVSKGDKNPMFGKSGELSPVFGRTGEKHPNCKISDSDMITLRKEIKSGNFTLTSLAKKYDVSLTLISNIKNNKMRKTNA